MGIIASVALARAFLFLSVIDKPFENFTSSLVISVPNGYPTGFGL